MGRQKNRIFKLSLLYGTNTRETMGKGQKRAKTGPTMKLTMAQQRQLLAEVKKERHDEYIRACNQAREEAGGGEEW